jgi:hypothetical protein
MNGNYAVPIYRLFHSTLCMKNRISTEPEIENGESDTGFIRIDAKKYIQDSVGKALEAMADKLR